jgi:hypothetical protein
MMEPGESHREIRKAGHNWLDMSIAISALLISATSLIVAIVHSRTLEHMAEANANLVEANSWPFLGYGTGNAGGIDGSAIEMRIANNGVGPAKIQSIELKWDGTPRRNAFEFLKACCGYKSDPANRVWTDLVSGRVLRAGETITFLTLPKTQQNAAAWQRLNAARISTRLTVNVCYCSVFDQCWMEDVVRFSLSPRPVDRCAMPSTPYGFAARP